ncbi:hypothetical protein [Streptococcus ovis]|uniref:hypothetical protein n=1 Tax=Streptococcus ovis TaxID=82806 RepID=UPI000371454F|nr:hypothetical protein [Streptococcus ovis]
MSNNIEIIMDIETLEIFEVIDLDEKEEGVDTDGTEDFPEEEIVLPYDGLNRVWTSKGYYYKPSSLLWRIEKDGVVHQLSPKNKHGTYPYYQRSSDYTWGRSNQLTQEEAMWLTLEFNPDLMNYV